MGNGAKTRHRHVPQFNLKLNALNSAVALGWVKYIQEKQSETKCIGFEDMTLSAYFQHFCPKLQPWQVLENTCVDHNCIQQPLWIETMRLASRSGKLGTYTLTISKLFFCWIVGRFVGSSLVQGAIIPWKRWYTQDHPCSAWSGPPPVGRKSERPTPSLKETSRMCGVGWKLSSHPGH